MPETEIPQDTQKSVRKHASVKELLHLFFIFFKIGCLTFGGGLAMLPQIQREVVDKHKWVTEDEIVDVFAISQSVPGVIALNSSVFIGQKIYGFPGALVATLGSIIPSFISISIFITILSYVQDNKYVKGAFTGTLSAATGLVLYSVVKLFPTSVKNLTAAILAAATFILVSFLGMYPIWVLLMAAAFVMTIFFINKKNVFASIISFVFIPSFIIYNMLAQQWNYAIALLIYVILVLMSYLYERNRREVRLG